MYDSSLANALWKPSRYFHEPVGYWSFQPVRENLGRAAATRRKQRPWLTRAPRLLHFFFFFFFWWGGGGAKLEEFVSAFSELPRPLIWDTFVFTYIYVYIHTRKRDRVRVSVCVHTHVYVYRFTCHLSA